MKEKGENTSLADYIEDIIFADAHSEVCTPVPEETAGFEKFLENYKKALNAEKAAAEILK